MKPSKKALRAEVASLKLEIARMTVQSHDDIKLTRRIERSDKSAVTRVLQREIRDLRECCDALASTLQEANPRNQSDYERSLARYTELRVK